MSVENKRMETNKDSNRGFHVSLKAKVISVLSIAGGLLVGCADKITGTNQEIDNQSMPPKVDVNIPEETQSSSPAIVPVEEGETIEITSVNYPKGPENFVLDERSNDEKMSLIKSWAPDDVEKEITLYNSEFKRIGIDLKDIEYKVSIVDGKSWVLYPRNKKTQTSYIVLIDNIIRPSIDLFGYLDKKESDDFFDLVPVNIKNAEVIGDKSGWHVFAQIKDGQVTQWYDASKDKINNVEIEPTPTPEPSYIINTDLPALSYYDMKAQVEQVAKNFSSITFEDFTSGRLLAFEQKYIAENPVFNEEVQSNRITKSVGKQSFGPSWGSYRADAIVYESSGINRDNINTRPLRILSYYVLNQAEFFKSIGFDPEMYNEKKLPFWLVTWAVYNDDGTTTLGHSLMDVIFYSSTLENVKRYNEPYSLPEDDLFLPTPEYKFYDLKIKEGKMGRVATLVPYLIYQKYPELQPDEELVDSWIKTRQMPEDLEGKLFGWGYYPSIWE